MELLTSLPIAIAQSYGGAILNLLLIDLAKCEDLGGNVSLTLESLAHLAEFVFHIWNEARLSTAVKHLRYVARSIGSDAAGPVLKCLSSLMSLPASLALQTSTVNEIFVDL